jgi:hypothetical protein
VSEALNLSFVWCTAEALISPLCGVQLRTISEQLLPAVPSLPAWCGATRSSSCSTQQPVWTSGRASVISSVMALILSGQTGGLWWYHKYDKCMLHQWLIGASSAHPGVLDVQTTVVQQVLAFYPEMLFSNKTIHVQMIRNTCIWHIWGLHQLVRVHTYTVLRWSCIRVDVIQIHIHTHASTSYPSIHSN